MYRQTDRVARPVPPDTSKAERLPRAIHELLLTVLAFDNTHGAEIAAMLNAGHFEPAYRKVAEPLLAYWRDYRRAPTETNLEALLSTQLAKRDEGLRRLLDGMLSMRETANGEFVVAQVSDFVERQALKAALVEAGELFASSDTAAIKTKLAEEVNRAYRPVQETIVMPMIAFTELPLPQPEMLMEPVLEAGDIVMLHSPPGHAKTALVMHWGVSQAAGGPCFGGKWMAARRARVLYVDGELPPNKLQRRLDRFRVKPTWFYVLSRRWALSQGVDFPSLYKPAGRAVLDRVIERVRAEVIFLDSIFTLFGVLTEREADQWVEVNEWLGRHQDAGRSFVLVHHDAKGKAGNAYGTVLRSVLIDTQISLSNGKQENVDEAAVAEADNHDEPEADGDARVLKVEFLKTREFGGADAEPFLLFFKVAEDHYEWRWAPMTKQKKAAPKHAEQVLAMLREGRPQKEIAAGLGLSPGRVSQIKSRLDAQGLL